MKRHYQKGEMNQNVRFGFNINGGLAGVVPISHVCKYQL